MGKGNSNLPFRKNSFQIIFILKIHYSKIMAQAHWLPNDNLVIWSGKTRSNGDSDQIDNILILAGGDILFFQPLNTISTYKQTVSNNIKNMSYTEFKDKYKLNIDYNTWNFLKNELNTKKIPPYQYKLKRTEYNKMINNYLTSISRYDDRVVYNEYVDIIENIINKMGNLKGVSIEKNVNLLRKLIKNIEKV